MNKKALGLAVLAGATAALLGGPGPAAGAVTGPPVQPTAPAAQFTPPAVQPTTSAAQPTTLAAQPATGPATRAAAAAPLLVGLIPQHVPQTDGLRMALTAGLPPTPGVTGIRVTQEPDLSLQTQKWELRFAPGGAVLQIVNAHTGLCLRGSSVAGDIVRQVKCLPSASVDDSRQFWRDRQTLHNGVVVHRYENADSKLYMGIRNSSPQKGALLESQVLNNLPSQKFKLK
ncbi:RICIN domain-containing protein [Planobispora longispora]|nr:RICIN domain-containing protein [Planobispora longispora]